MSEQVDMQLLLEQKKSAARLSNKRVSRLFRRKAAEVDGDEPAPAPEAVDYIQKLKDTLQQLGDKLKAAIEDFQKTIQTAMAPKPAEEAAPTA